ncbi:P2X purinoceptor 7 [Holothuria leucospilota]|uniref:P2X purinoceptor 7 n=1 Tax=Holothuria leucospilota TaxID=206669 RepID=A0A9Q1H339_HOLLE|nr:P2X purinoceptor 7 [Holothuria leucospilota]
MEQNDEASAVPLIQWCKCQMCRPMPLEIENKCCTRRVTDCISSSEAFKDVCLNAHVLHVLERNMRVKPRSHYNEFGSDSDPMNYIYWKYGRLGRGNRVVLPACCVRKIRERFPSANGQYRGFIPGENLQD